MSAPIVLLTDKLHNIINDTLADDKLERGVREDLEKALKCKLVSITDLKAVTERSGTPLHELLDGSDLHLPTVETPQKDAEYKARILRLRAEAENKEYEKMTRNVDISRSKKPQYISGVGAEVKAMNRELIAVFNFIVTVGGAFAFAYKATEYALESPNVIMQLCNGLVVGTVVFFADLYFLLKHIDD